MGAAQPDWGAAEQGPLVTEKGGVGQEVVLVAGSQNSPQAAVSPPWVEASVGQGPLRGESHFGCQVAEENKNLTEMADLGAPEARVGQAEGWGRKLESRGKKVEDRELQLATSPALLLAALRNPQTGPLQLPQRAVLRGVLGRGGGTGAVTCKSAVRVFQGGSLHGWDVTEHLWLPLRPENWKAQGCHRRPQSTSAGPRNWALGHTAPNPNFWIVVVAQLQQKHWGAPPSLGI